jgi:methylthioribulose 1-phosphate dehydratase/enolase-phosphatase E1
LFINVLTNKWSTIQIEDDLRNGISGAVPVPPDEAGKEEVINSLVANVESMIKADRKITPLKQLQVA